jgi:adenylylsulfate kinase
MAEGSGAGARPGNAGFVVWMTGLPCSGKSTLASRLIPLLQGKGLKVESMDGDVIRTHLSPNLGYSREDRDVNVKRVGFVSELLARNGVAVVAALVSPYADTRLHLRRTIGNYMEVFVDCPVEECSRRDVKGHYKKAARGEMKHFTGVDDPYEAPTDPDLHLRTDRQSMDECIGLILGALEKKGWLKAGKQG